MYCETYPSTIACQVFLRGFTNQCPLLTNKQIFFFLRDKACECLALNLLMYVVYAKILNPLHEGNRNSTIFYVALCQNVTIMPFGNILSLKIICSFNYFIYLPFHYCYFFNFSPKLLVLQTPTLYGESSQFSRISLENVSRFQFFRKKNQTIRSLSCKFIQVCYEVITELFSLCDRQM